jgi:hypothetical protein
VTDKKTTYSKFTKDERRARHDHVAPGRWWHRKRARGKKIYSQIHEIVSDSVDPRVLWVGGGQSTAARLLVNSRAYEPVEQPPAGWLPKQLDIPLDEPVEAAETDLHTEVRHLRRLVSRLCTQLGLAAEEPAQ